MSTPKSYDSYLSEILERYDVTIAETELLIENASPDLVGTLVSMDGNTQFMANGSDIYFAIDDVTLPNDATCLEGLSLFGATELNPLKLVEPLRYDDEDGRTMTVNYGNYDALFRLFTCKIDAAKAQRKLFS